MCRHDSFEKDGRRRGLAIGCLYAAMASAGLAETCGDEFQRIHGVWRSPEVYFALYADWDTVEYLNSLGVKAAGVSRPGVAVLPIYGSEAVHFRVRDFVFVSTGLIVNASEEQDLIDAIRSELEVKVKVKRRRWLRGWLPTSRRRSPPACAAPLGEPAGFAEMQLRVSAEVAQYAALYEPRLKRRAPPGQSFIGR